MEKILEVKNLQTTFHTEDGTVRAVDDVSFNAYKGKTLGIVLTIFGFYAVPLGIWAVVDRQRYYDGDSTDNRPSPEDDEKNLAINVTILVVGAGLLWLTKKRHVHPDATAAASEDSAAAAASCPTFSSER